LFLLLHVFSFHNPQNEILMVFSFRFQNVAKHKAHLIIVFKKKSPEEFDVTN
jgi:hypothetical protein